jgi:hypothetical protein
MIAQRDMKQLTLNEIAMYICDTSLDGYLTEAEFDKIIDELKTRNLHPEVLAKYIGFGQPAWRAKFN